MNNGDSENDINRRGMVQDKSNFNCGITGSGGATASATGAIPKTPKQAAASIPNPNVDNVTAQTNILESRDYIWQKLNENEEDMFFNFSFQLQSVMSQFSNADVRADFVNGLFDLAGDEQMLRNLDNVRWILFPRWSGHSGGSLVKVSRRFEQAKNHLKLLFNKSNYSFNFENNQFALQSYAEWHNKLEVIAQSRYWSESSTKEKCVHYQHTHNNPQYKESKQELNTPIKCKSRRVKSKIEESEDISSSSESMESSSSSSDESMDSHSKSHCSTRSKSVNNNKYNKKEVVQPPQFVMDGKVTLRDFLSTYESYFDNKFNGTQYDKTQELANFIDGKLFEVFNIKGGRRLKYTQMKEELLTWYAKQKIGGRGYWRNQFREVCYDHEESLDLYGMRLLEQFQLAYPETASEYSKKLKSRFLATIPSDIASKLKDAERYLKASNRKKPKVKFSVMVEMAHEMHHDQQRVVSFVRNKEKTAVYWNTNRLKSSPNKNKIDITNNEENRTTIGYNRNVNYLFCELCNKHNHRTENCWRASRSCLICGGDHWMRECQKFNPNYKARVQSTQGNF